MLGEQSRGGGIPPIIIPATVPVFPVLKGATFPIKRTPMWNTLHQEAISGQDNPIGLWTYNRWRYEIPFSAFNSGGTAFQALPAREWQTLAAFFNQVAGSSGMFQFHDDDDDTATGQLFGIGNGSTVAFPLVRTMTGAGGITWDELVYAPTTITSITVGGVPTAGYTVGTQGLITFNSPPAIGDLLTWTGTYNWLCRFDKDMMDFEKFMNNLWECKSVVFVTVKTQSK